jgi:hypothetical protein
LRQTLLDFANLALNPEVEQKTMSNLLAQANTTAEAIGAQTHADLVGLRQDMVSLLQGNGIGNVIGGPAAFGAPYTGSPNDSAAPYGAAPPTSSGSSSDAVVAQLIALRDEVGALRRERASDAQSEQTALGILSQNAKDEQAARSRQRAA